MISPIDKASIIKVAIISFSALLTITGSVWIYCDTEYHLGKLEYQWRMARK
jgi:hypothetical protein